MKEISKHLARQQAIIALATGADATPARIPYTPAEHAVWRTICNALAPLWQKHVSREILAASKRLVLPIDRIPQLTEVTGRLKSLTGFEFRAIGGLAPREEFFASLARRRFLSTQYIRSGETPFYTEQPDIVHEVIGHATLLADPNFAELHRLVGQALVSVKTEQAKQFFANVWWFSGEFGLVREGGEVRAVGAGLLSSVHELQNFQTVEHLPIDPRVMGATSYDIDHLQPKLFVAESMETFVRVMSEFFRAVDDDMVSEIMSVCT